MSNQRAIISTQSHAEATQRPSERHSEALRGTQRHSEALRRNQTHSEALRGHSEGTQRHSEGTGTRDGHDDPDCLRHHWWRDGGARAPVCCAIDGDTPAVYAAKYNRNAEVKAFFASGQHLQAARREAERREAERRKAERREAERREAERREAEVEAAVASQDVVALRQLMHASAHHDANGSQRRSPTTALPAHLHRAAYTLLLRHALDSPDPPMDAVDRADAEGSAAAQIESALRGFTGDGYDLITRGVLRLHEIMHLQARRPARGGWQAAWSEAHTLLGQLCDSAGTSMGGSASSAAALSASLASEHGLTELLALLRAAEEDGELTTYDDLAAATAAAEQ
eukprot:jgi/Chrpa1/24362/Chrysochromulina_OHIO_Genome00020418-RA